MLGRYAAPLLLALLILVSRPSQAAELPPHTAVHLAYESAGIKGCPDEQGFRDVIRAHMSYDPFSTSAETRLVVTIVRAGQAYRGRAELRDKTGAVIWPRELPLLTDCYSVVEGLGLAVSVKLDPVGTGGSKPSPPAESSPAAPQPRRTPESEPASTSAPQKVRPWINVGAAMVLGLGVAPRPAIGVVVAVGFQSPSWPEALWISLEGRAFPPAEGQADMGITRLRTWQATGAAVPCGSWRVFFGCGIVEMGALRATSDAEHSHDVTFFRFSLGLRAGVEWKALEHLALRASGDTLFSPVSQELHVDKEARWATPLIFGTLQAGLVASF